MKWKIVTAITAGAALLASAILVNLPHNDHIETVTAAGNRKHTIEDVRNLQDCTVSEDTSNDNVRTDFTNRLKGLELPQSKNTERQLTIKEIPSEYKQEIQDGGEITELKYETANGSKHALVFTPANYDEDTKM